MKKCKIVSITHSGRDGKRYSPRREMEFTDILGRQVLLDLKSIEIGENLSLTVLNDIDTYEVINKQNDKVVARRYIQSRKGSKYEIETEGSVYLFKELMNERV